VSNSVIPSDQIREEKKAWLEANAEQWAKVRDLALVPALGFNCLNLRRHGEKALVEQLDALAVEAMAQAEIAFQGQAEGIDEFPAVGIARGGVFTVVATLVYSSSRDLWKFDVMLPLAYEEIE